jgi:hypothetical protein
MGAGASSAKKEIRQPNWFLAQGYHLSCTHGVFRTDCKVCHAEASSRKMAQASDNLADKAYNLLGKANCKKSTSTGTIDLEDALSLDAKRRRLTALTVGKHAESITFGDTKIRRASFSGPSAPRSSSNLVQLATVNTKPDTHHFALPGVSHLTRTGSAIVSNSGGQAKRTKTELPAMPFSVAPAEAIVNPSGNPLGAEGARNIRASWQGKDSDLVLEELPSLPGIEKDQKKSRTAIRLSLLSEIEKNPTIVKKKNIQTRQRHTQSLSSLEVLHEETAAMWGGGGKDVRDLMKSHLKKVECLLPSYMPDLECELLKQRLTYAKGSNRWSSLAWPRMQRSRPSSRGIAASSSH